MVRTSGRNTSKGNGINGLFLLFFAFIAGFGCASMWDINEIIHWLNIRLLNKPSISVQSSHDTNQQTMIPKPKFEFYTLLANGTTVNSEKNKVGSKEENQKAMISQLPTITLPTKKSSLDSPHLASTEKLPLHAPFVAEEPAKPSSVAIASGTYLIQIGSFRNLQEAEKMKATLVLKGFTVYIHSTIQQQIPWYRVTIGPFVSRQAAQKAQLAFARSEHIMGIIRKMEA